MDKQFFHRKDRIILTAIEIINELGIQGLSTREIARRQEISEGTLFRHYKSKNDIILAVLDDFSKYDADIFHSVELKKLKPQRSTYLFCRFFYYVLRKLSGDHSNNTNVWCSLLRTRFCPQN